MSRKLIQQTFQSTNIQDLFHEHVCVCQQLVVSGAQFPADTPALRIRARSSNFTCHLKRGHVLLWSAI